ncbi:MAG: flavodoxin family protein [Ignisphaera sp.]
MEYLNKVKILVVSASPRKYGAVSFVREFVIKLCKDIEKVDAVAIDVYDFNIMPCIGCVSDNVKLCKLPCVIDDDMKKLYEYVIHSDGIIFITPIYWYNVPGPLKNFIDRLTVLENAIFTEGRSKMEGKVAGFIAVGSDVGAMAVIQNLMAIMNSFGVIIPPWALAYHESENEPISNEKFLLDVANVIRCVVLMAKLVKEGKEVDYWYRADEEYKLLILSTAREIYTSIENSLYING